MPMLGKADSLNAAVATAVMAYEVDQPMAPAELSPFIIRFGTGT